MKSVRKWWLWVAMAAGAVALAGPGGLATAAGGTLQASVLGPVNEVIPVSASVSEVVVVGRSIMVDRGVTVFQDQTGAGFGFDALATEDIVEVQGVMDAGGPIWADRIVKFGRFDPASVGALEVSSTGRISPTVLSSRYSLDQASVIVPSAAERIDLPNGIGLGMVVEVRGTLTAFGALTGFVPSFTEITASSVRLVRLVAPPDRPAATYDGVVTGFDPATATFLINGFTVDARGAFFVPATLAQSLGDGVRVVATGPIVDAVLQAVTVRLPGF